MEMLKNDSNSVKSEQPVLLSTAIQTCEFSTNSESGHQNAEIAGSTKKEDKEINEVVLQKERWMGKRRCLAIKDEDPNGDHPASRLAGSKADLYLCDMSCPNLVDELFPGRRWHRPRSLLA